MEKYKRFLFSGRHGRCRFHTGTKPRHYRVPAVICRAIVCSQTEGKAGRSSAYLSLSLCVCVCVCGCVITGCDVAGDNDLVMFSCQPSKAVSNVCYQIKQQTKHLQTTARVFLQ